MASDRRAITRNSWQIITYVLLFSRLYNLLETFLKSESNMKKWCIIWKTMYISKLNTIIKQATCQTCGILCWLTLHVPNWIMFAIIKLLVIKKSMVEYVITEKKTPNSPSLWECGCDISYVKWIDTNITIHKLNEYISVYIRRKMYRRVIYWRLFSTHIFRY